jgi:hypothetical protein
VTKTSSHDQGQMGLGFRYGLLFGGVIILVLGVVLVCAGEQWALLVAGVGAIALTTGAVLFVRARRK